jgi:hypothetical protein
VSSVRSSFFHGAQRRFGRHLDARDHRVVTNTRPAASEL